MLSQKLSGFVQKQSLLPLGREGGRVGDCPGVQAWVESDFI